MFSFKKIKIPAMPRIDLNRESKAMLYRWLVSGILWFFLIGCFLMGIQSRIATSKAMEYVSGKAITPDTAEATRSAAELARGFAVEWATFDGEDASDYIERLSVYLSEGRVEPPTGMQKCIAANVLSVKTIPGLKAYYRVRVMLHVSRLVDIPESQSYSMSEARRVAIKNQDDKNTSEPIISVWQEKVMNTEITVGVQKGKSFIVGLPVIVPNPQADGVAVNKYMGIDNEVPSDFTIFIQQALTMYFEGNDMANFVEPGAQVLPLGGYKVKNVAVTSFKQSDENAKAVVNATVSSQGMDDMQISIVVETVKKDRWLIRRIGSW